MFVRFGARVTIVQRADRLLVDEDPDVSQVLEEVSPTEDIEVLTSTTRIPNCTVLAVEARLRTGGEDI